MQFERRLAASGRAAPYGMVIAVCGRIARAMVIPIPRRISCAGAVVGARRKFLPATVTVRRVRGGSGAAVRRLRAAGDGMPVICLAVVNLAIVYLTVTYVAVICLAVSAGSVFRIRLTF